MTFEEKIRTGSHHSLTEALKFGICVTSAGSGIEAGVRSLEIEALEYLNNLMQRASLKYPEAQAAIQYMSRELNRRNENAD